jgi:isopentenyldiphosphate isomerase
VLFTAKVVDDSRFKKQDEEIAELRWVDRGKVEELLTYDDWKEVWRKIEKVL